MQKIKFIVFSLLAVLISCSGNEENSYESTVYIVGGNDITEPIATSVLWINDDIMELSEDKYSGVNSVYVNDGNVYAAGYEYEDEYYNNQYYATLWTNGTPTVLSQHPSCAYSVFAQGKVYAAGYEKIGDKYFATLWSNSVTARLSNLTSVAYSVCVSQGKIYVVGAIENANGVYNAVVWKNGVSTILSTNSSAAYSVFEKNGNVYIAGENNDKATLWVNGEAETLSTEYSTAHSVFVANNRVYVAGEKNSIATLWKDGVPTALSTNTSSAHGVFVAGGNVYVAGITNELIDHRVGYPTLWINGEQKLLPVISRFIDPFNCYVSGIFVK